MKCEHINLNMLLNSCCMVLDVDYCSVRGNLVFNYQKVDLVCQKDDLVVRPKVDLVVIPIPTRLLRQKYEIVNEEFNTNNSGNYPRHDKKHE